MNNESFKILAIDADNAGRLVGRSILADDEDALHEVSSRIELGAEIIARWAESNGGIKISSGGDEATVKIPIEAMDHIDELRKDYQFATNLTITVGVGNTLSEAGKSLLVGKFRGKNQVVNYDPNIESEIKQAQINLEQGTASPEEKKLGEAYLKPDGGTAAVTNNLNTPDAQNEEMNDKNSSHVNCPYCQESNANHDPNSAEHSADCPYCKIISEHDSETCPYCQEMESDTHNPDEDGHPDDCPYCAESASDSGNNEDGTDQSIAPTEGGDSVSLPTTQSSQNFAAQDLNTPDMPKPSPLSKFPIPSAVDNDIPTNENVKLEREGEPNEEIPQTSSDEMPQGKQASDETVQDIVQQIDKVPEGSISQEKDAVKNVDDANIPEGNVMEGNISRPEGFQGNVPTDLGLPQDDVSDDQKPDMSSILHEGLNNNADDIQKERITQLVASSLADFKECKDFIEASQQQSPKLYSSSISMLKAMIEMAKLLGLDKKAEMQPKPDAQSAPSKEGRHGDPSQAMSDGGAKDPKPSGQLAKQ